MNASRTVGKTASTSPIEVGSRLELFVDDYLIDRLENARLKLHAPVRRGTAIAFDEPWEGAYSAYPTVLKDGEVYRAYYRGRREGKGTDAEEVTCCAESQDGVKWVKPNLRIYEVGGTLENNVTLAGPPPIPHNFTPFIDSRPGTPSSERFKALGGLINFSDEAGKVRHDGVDGVMAFVSSDGVRWRPMQEEPVMDRAVHPLPTDTAQSCAFWSELEGQYVCYMRMWYDAGGKPHNPGWDGDIRWIGRTVSDDFLHWSAAELVSFGDAPPEHLYTNQIQPYFRAPHIYLGFPFRFLPERQLVPEHPVSGVSDGVIISSRDGVNWDRTFLESYLRPGRDRRNWTDRNMIIACGIVPTAEDELSLYWIENVRHETCRLNHGTLRMDGFASLNGPYGGGELITKPLVFSGSELVVNFATSAAGSVGLELLDVEGRPLQGMSLENHCTFVGDEIDGKARWKNGADLAKLAGSPIRMRWVLRDADVYSFRFQ